MIPLPLPFRGWTLLLLFFFDLNPVPGKLSPGMSVLVWVLNCHQSLGIPQVNKELLSRVFISSKEPIMVPDLGVLNYVEDVRLAPAPLLDDLERDGPAVLQLEVKFLAKATKVIPEMRVTRC